MAKRIATGGTSKVSSDENRQNQSETQTDNTMGSIYYWSIINSDSAIISDNNDNNSFDYNDGLNSE